MNKRSSKLLLLILVISVAALLASCMQKNFFSETVRPPERPRETAEVTEEPTEEPTEKPRDKEKRDKYYEFLERAEAIEEYSEESYQTAMDQVTMNRESYYIYCEWDELLNDIYNYLKRVMDKDEFADLEADELEWIREKEAAVEEAGNEVLGGSMEPLMRNSTAATYTSERCYYLMSLLK